MNLNNFKYRKEKVKAKEIFHKFNLEKLKSEFKYEVNGDPHQAILNITLDLWNGGYDFILDNFGFHDKKYSSFSGHCHQITPALGVVLATLGFKVAYLEAYRLDPFSEEMMDPKEEQSDMKEEFCSIGRIPYCCLEVEIEGEKFYISGKHIKREDGEIKALLTATCYRDFIGVFAHPKDLDKSGIYLETVVKEPFTWRKQTAYDKEVEFFKTFAYMQIEV